MADEYRDVPVLMGWQELVYPTPLPFWALPKTKRRVPEGQLVNTAYTNNVRFSIALVEDGLRFNESLGLMGGEDNEFFAEAKMAGFEIRRTNRAITREDVHPERLTYRAQLYREYWCSASNIRKFALQKGWLWTVTRKAHTLPLNAECRHRCT